MDRAWEEWANDASDYFKMAFGLSSSFSRQAARLYILLHQNGLNPQITSGYRDPARQKQLQQLWDSGRRVGLRARPASNSKHSNQDWLGRPSAKAIDIKSSDEARAARLAQSIGIGAGLFFGVPDPGHYYEV